MTTTTQLIDTPATIPGFTNYQQLGYIEAYDAVTNGAYAFVAYKETDSTGDWRVRIAGYQTPGAVFEPDSVRSNARAASAQGKTWFPWGWAFDPSERDARNIQFRVHVSNGDPHEIEMFVQLRTHDGSAEAPKSVRFPWPDEHSADA